MPSFASAAENDDLAPSRTDRFAVAIDNLARTRSKGYVAPARQLLMEDDLGPCANSQTATIPAPAPAVNRKGVDNVSSPCAKRFLNAPYEVNCSAE